jgi:hypothetical protein
MDADSSNLNINHITGRHCRVTTQEWSWLWVEMCASQRHAQVLTPGTHECDLIRTQDLDNYNQVRIRSYWIRMSSPPMIAVLWKQRNLGRDRAREEGGRELPAEKATRSSKRKGGVLPYSLQREHGSVNTWSQSEQGESNFCPTLSVGLCDHSPRDLSRVDHRKDLD